MDIYGVKYYMEIDLLSEILYGDLSYECNSVCVCIYIYIYIYIERERESERERERERLIVLSKILNEEGSN
jgi:hypothetical protein